MVSSVQYQLQDPATNNMVKWAYTAGNLPYQERKSLTAGNGDLDLDRDLQKFQKQPI